METESGHTKKRPTCPNCSKPIKICLCARLKSPVFQNSIAVTILQHSLEKKHPLNSTRIATIGLKDVSVSSVSDVNFQARFFIRFLVSDEHEGSDFGKRKWDFVEMPLSLNVFEKPSNFGAGEYDEGLCPSSLPNGEFSETRMDYLEIKKRDINIMANGAVSGRSGGAVFTFTIEKYGVIKSSFDHHLLDSKKAAELLTKGFVVKKLQTKQLNGTTVVDLEEFEEFDIKVPPGSILLFPSEKSVGIEAIDFEVKNLIVLDGTWAKAKRMYNENPWLKLLPHVKLEITDKLSLYSEVRHQPRAGYLSTIESIVYALKAFGENSDKLDCLLDLFESMVGDQRRCRDERLSSSSSRVST